MTGGSLIGWTVRRKAVLAEMPSPSVTVTVMVAVPDWFVAGKMVKVRLLLLPLRIRLAFGTNMGLLELATTNRAAAGVSTSSTVSDLELGTSSSVKTFEMVEIA